MFCLATTHEKRNVYIPKHPATTTSLHTGKLSNSPAVNLKLGDVSKRLSGIKGSPTCTRLNTAPLH